MQKTFQRVRFFTRNMFSQFATFELRLFCDASATQSRVFLKCCDSIWNQLHSYQHVNLSSLCYHMQSLRQALWGSYFRLIGFYIYFIQCFCLRFLFFSILSIDLSFVTSIQPSLKAKLPLNKNNLLEKNKQTNKIRLKRQSSFILIFPSQELKLNFKINTLFVSNAQPQFGYYMILRRKCGALLFLFYFIYVHVFIFLRNLNVSQRFPGNKLTCLFGKVIKFSVSMRVPFSKRLDHIEQSLCLQLDMTTIILRHELTNFYSISTNKFYVHVHVN